jgi:phage-related tail fiber protein
MTLKNKIIISSVVIATAFAFGRYTAPKSAGLKETTMSQTDTKQDSSKDTHTVTKVVYVEDPNGRKETDTITTTDTVAHVVEDTDTSTKSVIDIKPAKINTLNVSALASTKGLSSISYGLSVTKQVPGPITIGGFGLTDGTIGVSVGLNF